MITSNKFILSAIDNIQYCVSNGKFTLHLKEHNLTFQQYWEKYVTFSSAPICDHCLCNTRIFCQKTRNYTVTCGHDICVRKELSKRSICSANKRKGILKETITKEMLFNNYVIQNLTVCDIAKLYKVGDASVTNLLREYQITKKQKRTLKVEEYAATIIDLYTNQNQSLKTISLHYNVSESAIRNTLTKNHIDIKEPKQYDKPYKLTKDELYHDYVIDEKTQTEISKLYDININTIKTMLDAYEIPIRPKKSCTDAQIIEAYNEEKNPKRIAELFNVCHQTVYDVLNASGVVFNGNVSYGENEVNEYIKSLGFVTIQSDRTVLNTQELDIVIPELNIAIEYNGLYWHSSKFRNAYYHKQKTKNAKIVGYRLIHIFEDEWLNNTDVVKAKLSAILKRSSSSRVYARKTQIKDVNIYDQREFMNANHIQGYGSGSIAYGLHYNNELVAVMNFIKTKKGYKLNRYCTSCQVIGGFSKLFKHFTKVHDPLYVETFADLRWSSMDHNVYDSNHFIFDSVTEPNYFYVDENNIKRLCRQKFMKHKLHKLNIFDPALSEKQNMLNNGYYQIHDCGNIKFIWKKI